MTILYLMIPLSLILGASFLGIFIWCVQSGQLDDLDTPAHRILDTQISPNSNSSANEDNA